VPRSVGRRIFCAIWPVLASFVTIDAPFRRGFADDGRPYVDAVRRQVARRLARGGADDGRHYARCWPARARPGKAETAETPPVQPL
jgi:hypothetical protein